MVNKGREEALTFSFARPACFCTDLANNELLLSAILRTDFKQTDEFRLGFFGLKLLLGFFYCLCCCCWMRTGSVVDLTNDETERNGDVVWPYASQLKNAINQEKNRRSFHESYEREIPRNNNNNTIKWYDW